MKITMRDIEKRTSTAATAKKEQGKKKNYYRIRLTKKI
jgi:hypothetical protein